MCLVGRFQPSVFASTLAQQVLHNIVFNGSHTCRANWFYSPLTTYLCIQYGTHACRATLRPYLQQRFHRLDKLDSWQPFPLTWSHLRPHAQLWLLLCRISAGWSNVIDGVLQEQIVNVSMVVDGCTVKRSTQAIQ